MEFIIQLFGLLCGGLCWVLILLAWLTYVGKGKLPRPMRYIGTGIILAPMILVVVLVATWFGAEARHDQLLHAAFNGDTAGIERALNAGANVNEEEENMHFTLLMCAVGNGHTATVQAILRHHPDLNHRGVQGTALQMAVERKDVEIIHLLKAAGAKE